MSLYERLRSQVEREGKHLPLDLLTEDLIFDLWVKERVPDSCIANLFGLEKKDIRKLRTKFRIDRKTELLYAVLKG